MQNYPYSFISSIASPPHRFQRQNRAPSQFEQYEQLDRFSTRRNMQLQRKHAENTPKNLSTSFVVVSALTTYSATAREPQFFCHACRAARSLNPTTTPAEQAGFR
jgi:hypothetical protein